MTELDAFPLFRNLPVELQSMVWDCAFHLYSSHTSYGIYLEHRPARPSEPGFYVNLPIFPAALGRPRPVLGGMGAINGLDAPQGTIRLQGGWTEVGDEKESQKMRERVLVFPATGLPILLHATRGSRRAVLQALKILLEGLLAEMCNTTDEEGKPRTVQQEEWLKKANGQVLANVVNHLLGNEDGTKCWWQDAWVGGRRCGF